MRDASDHDEKVPAAAQPGDGEQTEQPGDELTEQPGSEQAEQPGDELTEQPGDELTEQPGGELTEQPGSEQAEQLRREQAELARLREENSKLRGQVTAPRRHRVRGTVRATAAAVLITLGCVLAPVTVLAIWTANQVSDTGRYVANVAPLIHEPSVQNALTDRITTEITNRLDVQALASQAATALDNQGLSRVASLLNSFSAPLAGAVNGFIHTQVAKIVASPQVATLWTQLNETAHAQIVKVLSGQGGGAITVANNQVTLDLGPFIKVVQTDLGKRFPIINSIPPVHPSFVLFEAKNLSKAQAGYRLINDLKYVLPVLTLLFLGLGVYVARKHRRALIVASLGVAASMFVLAIGLQIGRGIYLNGVPPSLLPPDAAAAMYDTLVRFIKDGLRLLFVLGLIVAAVAVFTGPSAPAVKTRRAIGGGINKLGSGAALTRLRTGPVGEWTYAHRMAVRIGATALAAIIFIFWPSAVLAIVLAIVLLLVLGFVELIGKPAGTQGVPQAGT